MNMKRLPELWNGAGTTLRPRMELPESAARVLGFRPALLDVATMRIYPAGSPEARGPIADRVIGGFERDGFFYTHRAAARACREWGVGN
jgi:hypothetical protein